MMIRRLALSYPILTKSLRTSTHLIPFSTQKPNPSQSSQSTSSQSSSPNPSSSSTSSSRNPTISSLQAQQIKSQNDRINLTKGTYSPFVEYLKLHKMLLFGIGMGVLALGFIWRIWSMAGLCFVEELEVGVDGVVGIKRKKKFAIVSQQYEQKHLSEHISNIFLSIYPEIPPQTLTPIPSQKHQTLTKSLSTYFSTQITLTPISTQQPIILSLPSNKILISKSLLRTNQLNLFQLEFLLVLTHQLFRQGYHLRTLALGELGTFWGVGSVGSQIRFRQIYGRRFKRAEILNTIDLVKFKLNIPANSALNTQITELFPILKSLSNQLTKVQSTPCQQNLYNRLHKYYILVKVQ